MHLSHWIMGQDLRMSTASLFAAVCVCVRVCLFACLLHLHFHSFSLKALMPYSFYGLEGLKTVGN